MEQPLCPWKNVGLSNTASENLFYSLSFVTWPELVCKLFFLHSIIFQIEGGKRISLPTQKFTNYDVTAKQYLIKDGLIC